ncbi:MAG TPA: FAD-binding oxidoreductase [Opitutaceae bacterium]|nr:FAD-binding oxidoreductase [Opitutaceae bacterium]
MSLPEQLRAPPRPPPAGGTVVNDLHSELNATRVARILAPRSAAEVAAAIRAAADAGGAVSLCGARHAMGGQQFGAGTTLLDLAGLRGIGPVDRARGLVECGAGVMWPELIRSLHAQQEGEPVVWTIRQKQTGADRLTLGGALAANAHGRGLRLRPMIDDIEAFTLVDAAGAIHRCSRGANAGLFRLAVGGYGCFGAVTSVCLRLMPRRKLERVVEVIALDRLMPAFEARIAAGFLYGDFQFSIDERAPDFLRKGVFSCYRPVDDPAPLPARQKELRASDWERLIHLAHTDRARVFHEYAGYYLSTNGQRYWSDTHQLSVYLDHYHHDLDRRLGATVKATEMISELYVPRARLADFMARAAEELRPRGVPVIYGTVRLIERDAESFLAWAREDWACVIFNLHTEHAPAGLERSADAFRALIDAALAFGGSYFLTYHRWARRDQVERAYPQFRDFLGQKQRLDPACRFQSDWWRHHRAMFEGVRP